MIGGYICEGRHTVETLYFWKATRRIGAHAGHKPVLFLQGGFKIPLLEWQARWKVSGEDRRNSEEKPLGVSKGDGSEEEDHPDDRESRSAETVEERKRDERTHAGIKKYICTLGSLLPVVVDSVERLIHMGPI